MTQTIVYYLIALNIVTFFVYKGIHKALRWEKPAQKEELEVVDVEAK